MTPRDLTPARVRRATGQKYRAAWRSVHDGARVYQDYLTKRGAKNCAALMAHCGGTWGALQSPKT